MIFRYYLQQDLHVHGFKCKTYIYFKIILFHIPFLHFIETCHLLTEPNLVSADGKQEMMWNIPDVFIICQPFVHIPWFLYYVTYLLLYISDFFSVNSTRP